MESISLTGSCQCKRDFATGTAQSSATALVSSRSGLAPRIFKISQIAPRGPDDEPEDWTENQQRSQQPQEAYEYICDVGRSGYIAWTHP